MTFWYVVWGGGSRQRCRLHFVFSSWDQAVLGHRWAREVAAVNIFIITPHHTRIDDSVKFVTQTAHDRDDLGSPRLEKYVEPYIYIYIYPYFQP